MKKIMFMLAVVTSMALPMIAEEAAAPVAPASTNKVEKAKCEAAAKVAEKAAVAK
jgi:hypothetical protein